MGTNNQTCVNFLIGSAMPQKSICKVSEKNIQSFSRNIKPYRKTDKHTNQQTDTFD